MNDEARKRRTRYPVPLAVGISCYMLAAIAGRLSMPGLRPAWLYAALVGASTHLGGLGHPDTLTVWQRLAAWRGNEGVGPRRGRWTGGRRWGMDGVGGV
ncbi:hypothetical protein GCM10010121_100430 [Streptomyces brasiliensis]|uniref:Uncharacterized protein n=1 Tax=Streptomyces brasiliensis TaxID=1954 RepID=A0A917PFC3_9ACTN|nr:hypothetical protein GCM10010121_100430 [Streptomyces brasiliensis]